MVKAKLAFAAYSISGSRRLVDLGTYADIRPGVTASGRQSSH